MWIENGDFQMPQEYKKKVHLLKHYCHAQTQLRPHVNVRIVVHA